MSTPSGTRAIRQAHLRLVPARWADGQGQRSCPEQPGQRRGDRRAHPAEAVPAAAPNSGLPVTAPPGWATAGPQSTAGPQCSPVAAIPGPAVEPAQASWPGQPGPKTASAGTNHPAPLVRLSSVAIFAGELSVWVTAVQPLPQAVSKVVGLVRTTGGHRDHFLAQMHSLSHVSSIHCPVPDIRGRTSRECPPQCEGAALAGTDPAAMRSWENPCPGPGSARRPAPASRRFETRCGGG